MPPTIIIAAVQMEATPARTAARLDRAGRLVAAAAQAGAKLVLLPELFNTGYAYTDENFRRAEPLDGPTSTWLKQTAACHQIHLAGSLLLLDKADIYNALLLFAPDGRYWRYNKRYPWGWERGYFRPGHGPTVAETDLGAIGMMICWDVAHPNLWRQYAGRVDLMLLASCPPDVTRPTYHFPNGDHLTLDDLGPLMAQQKGTGRQVFGDMINQQTAWLGVPAVNTVGTGHIKTNIPNGLLSLLTMLPAAPRLVRYLFQAHRLQLSCEMVPGCKIVDESGRVLADLPLGQGEAFTLAEVTLAEAKRSPQDPQPASPLNRLAYLWSDIVLPWLTLPVYRRGLRRLVSRKASAPRRLVVGVVVAMSLGLTILLWSGFRKKKQESRLPCKPNFDPS